MKSLITAKQARQYAEAYDPSSDILEKIFERIEENSKLGQNSIEQKVLLYPRSSVDYVKEELFAHGYTVVDALGGNIKISW